MFKSLSVQDISSTSMLFEVEGVEDDGSGKMKSLRTCSLIALHLDSKLRKIRKRQSAKDVHLTSEDIAATRSISSGIQANCWIAAGSPLSLTNRYNQSTIIINETRAYISG